MTTGLTVAGTTIPIAAQGVTRTRGDHVDRAEALDGTYKASQVGGARRDWHFQTPPVTRALADTYEPILAGIAAVTCTGDVVSLPTMCCPEIMNWVPVVTAQGHSIVIDFVLHEVQPAKSLLSYVPGNTITGESFTRASTATYRDANGNVVSVGNDVKRDSNYVLSGGVATRTLLLEDTRTNICLQSGVLGTTWATAAATVGTNVTTSPENAATGDKIQEDNTTAIHGVTQTITCASAIQTFSIWVKSAERTKCVVAMNDNTGGSAGIGVDLSNGTTFAAGLSVGSWTGISSVVEAWGSSWYRVMLTATRGAGTQTVCEVFTWTTVLSYLGVAGNGIYAWGGQLEMVGFASSYIATTTVSVVRSADLYSIPFTTTPQEMSSYMKFVERGTVLTTAAPLFDISNAAATSATFSCYAPSALYAANHNPAGAGLSSTLGIAPAFGDTAEITTRLFGDGSVDITQSVNSAAATSGTQTAANALATAWSAQLLYLNSFGTSAGVRGYVAIQSFKLVAGMRSLAEMRLL